ncbi:MAG: DUF2335 domain-containing protein, partial [Zoogloeaceae bacterium]|nr:DUF2335 domain-containing protein [Zoogloeaceae bacterium]
MNRNDPPSARTSRQPRGIIATSEHFEGPLPHPETLERYQKILPTAAERIFNDFEKTAQHLRETQQAALVGTIEKNRREHWMAFVLIFSGLLLSGVFAWLDKDALAYITLGTTVGTIVWGYLRTQK